MRGAMPSGESVLFLMGSVAMEMGEGCYSFSVSAFKNIDELKKKDIDLYYTKNTYKIVQDAK